MESGKKYVIAHLGKGIFRALTLTAKRLRVEHPSSSFLLFLVAFSDGENARVLGSRFIYFIYSATSKEEYTESLLEEEKRRTNYSHQDWCIHCKRRRGYWSRLTSIFFFFLFLSSFLFFVLIFLRLFFNHMDRTRLRCASRFKQIRRSRI